MNTAQMQGMRIMAVVNNSNDDKAVYQIRQHGRIRFFMLTHERALDWAQYYKGAVVEKREDDKAGI